LDSRLHGNDTRADTVRPYTIHLTSLGGCRQLGLLNFFPVRMYSYEFGFRKPDLRFFHEAARRLGVPPAQTLFVGDRIGADVRGSRAAGMIPVLLSAHTNTGKRPPEGVLCIDRLAELPAILDNRNTTA
jgi:putative hydrolase of the HAD superfamily